MLAASPSPNDAYHTLTPQAEALFLASEKVCTGPTPFCVIFGCTFKCCHPAIQHPTPRWLIVISRIPRRQYLKHTGYRSICIRRQPTIQQLKSKICRSRRTRTSISDLESWDFSRSCVKSKPNLDEVLMLCQSNGKREIRNSRAQKYVLVEAVQVDLKIEWIFADSFYNLLPFAHVATNCTRCCRLVLTLLHTTRTTQVSTVNHQLKD